MYVVWKKFQRRVESLAPEMDASIVYFHYSWEEYSQLHKVTSYGLKFLRTLATLLNRRPDVIFVQLAPTPALYAVAAYAVVSGAEYVADCHNSMIYGHWIRWPLARRLLRRSRQILVHNADVEEKAKSMGLRAHVLRTPLPKIEVRNSREKLQRLSLSEGRYVIVPGNFADDEPLEETLDAARRLPDLRFVFTWFSERLPDKARDNAPPNAVFTGYLSADAFNAVFAHAAAAVVLTKREGTQPSGAAEAISLEVPVVLSDLETTRRMNGQAAVYVSNSGPSIAEGVRRAITDASALQAEMRALKMQVASEMRTQILALKTQLRMPTEIVHLDHIRAESHAETIGSAPAALEI